jgi:hypothetical protein
MNRSRTLIGAAIALLAFALQPHTADAQIMGGQAVTGTYNVQVTGDVFVSGTARLTQQGTRIVGTGPAKAGGNVQFSGTLENNKLSGTWRSPSNETGWFTLWFTQNGRGFDGEWGYHGRSPNGSVVGTRR